MNIKFEKFTEMLFNSKLKSDQIKKEINEYVKALETKYNQKLMEMRLRVDRERKKKIYQESIKVNEATEKNELETLFVDCIEEVRKDIMKRRLK